MRPEEAMQPTRAAVLVALLSIFAESGRVTVREISDEVDISTSTCHAHLLVLRRDGLIAWEPGRDGTLRPLVRAEALA